MNKERVNDYLEDIRPTKLRLKQVEYLLKTPEEYNLIRASNFDERVQTCTIGDNTANSVIQKLDRRTDLKQEYDELKCKLALYEEWITHAGGEIYTDLINQLYVEGHSTNWISITSGYENNSIQQRKFRLIAQLAKYPIEVITQQEKLKIGGCR